MAIFMDGVRLSGAPNRPATIRDGFADRDAPKYKFNFYMELKFRSAYPQPKHSGASSVTSNLFALKQASRVTPVINYADVNYYGFRTKVATKVDFSVLNIILYDDSSNRSHDILEKYMEAVSPITQVNNAQEVRDSQTIKSLYDGSELGVIDHIKITHFHLQGETKYTYFNPKISNVMLDELDMTASDVTTVSFAMVYDAFKIEQIPSGSAATSAPPESLSRNPLPPVSIRRPGL